MSIVEICRQDDDTFEELGLLPKTEQEIGRIPLKYYVTLRHFP